MSLQIPASMQRITDFDSTRQSPLPRERLEATRKAALAFRERFMDEPEVLFYKSKLFKYFFYSYFLAIYLKSLYYLGTVKLFLFFVNDIQFCFH